MPQDTSDARSQFHSVAGVPPEVPSRPALKLDPESYRQFVSDAGLSRAQEDALLEALWTIIVSFVDLGFGLHPIQQVAGDISILDVDSAGVLASTDISDSTTSLIAAATHERAAERIDS